MKKQGFEMDKTILMLNYAEKFVKDAPSSLQKHYDSIYKIDKLLFKLQNDNPEKVPKLNRVKKIAEFYMFTQFLLADMAVLIRFFCSTGKYQYEQKYALRQFVVLENEAFKRFYHFSQGDKTRYRNKSLWGSLIKPIVEKEMPNFHAEYTKLTTDLDYLSEILQPFQTPRMFFVHYFEDSNTPSDLWLEVSKLNAVSVFNALTPFVKLIKNISDFLYKIFSEYGKMYDFETQDQSKSFNERIEELEAIAKKSEREDLIISLDRLKRLLNDPIP